MLVNGLKMEIAKHSFVVGLLAVGRESFQLPERGYIKSFNGAITTLLTMERFRVMYNNRSSVDQYSRQSGGGNVYIRLCIAFTSHVFK